MSYPSKGKKAGGGRQRGCLSWSVREDVVLDLDLVVPLGFSY